MSCNSQIHDELKNMGESTCPFCDKQLVKVCKLVESSSEGRSSQL